MFGWQAQPFGNFFLVDGLEARADLSAGRRKVILFNRECDACTTYLSRLAASGAPDSQAAPIRLMDIAGVGPRKSGDFVPPFRETSLRPGVLYVTSVPVEVSLNDGIVESIHLSH